MLKIVGKQNVDYVSRKTNNPVTGVTLHCVGKSGRVMGEAVETLFVSTKSPMYEQCMNYPIGTEIEVSYNRFGSVETIEKKK